MKDLSTKQADAMLFFVALLWGTGFTVTKIALDVFSTVQLLFFRFFIAAIFSLIIFHKDMRKMNKSDLKAGIIMGIFLTLGYIFQTFGLEGTSAGKSAFLTGTNVVMVPFLAWFVSKKKPGKNNIIAAILMFLGIILLTVDFKNFGEFNVADMLTFFCAISFAWQIVATGIFSGDKNPYIISTVQLSTCAVIFSVMMFFDKTPLHYTTTGAYSMVYLSIVTTLVCFLMQTIGQKYTSSSHAAIVLSLESVCGSVFGVMFLGEKYNYLMVIAFVVIFMSILIAEGGFDSFFNKRNLEIN
jgi:drug/metabolite transporter (DMT)-like permease